MSSSPAPLGEFSSWLNRLTIAFFLGGQVFFHLLQAKLHRRNTLEQMKVVGPDSVAIALVTAAFVGMVMTIQLAREFIKYGATSTIGGFLALALTRELAPVLTAVVVAGRVGSAFAAEIGTMRVTEQIDALYMLRTDPIDYLVVPRVFACGFMLPILTILSLIVGLLGGLAVADSLYGIPSSVFLKSVQNFLELWDVASAIIKSFIFGCLIAIIGCSWGLTTTGGAKGVGQSTTTAVVTSLLAIFVANFFMSWIMYQGLGHTKSG
jgi:phospholipid/cholesterol/gamma-HCH transport system permease protein